MDKELIDGVNRGLKARAEGKVSSLDDFVTNEELIEKIQFYLENSNPCDITPEEDAENIYSIIIKAGYVQLAVDQSLPDEIEELSNHDHIADEIVTTLTTPDKDGYAFRRVK